MSRYTTDTLPLQALVARAGVLSRIAGEVLSPFEAQLIADVGERLDGAGHWAIVSDREAAVLAEAVAGMETHLRRAYAAGALRLAQAHTPHRVRR